MGKLAQGAAALKEGAIVVTMTDPIPSPAFEVLEEVSTKETPVFLRIQGAPSPAFSALDGVGVSPR